MLLEIANMFFVTPQFIKIQTNNFCINLRRRKYHTGNELEQHYKTNIFDYCILRTVNFTFFLQFKTKELRISVFFPFKSNTE